MKKNFFQRIISPTPAKWKRIAGLFGTLTLVFTASYGAVAALSIPMPEWFSLYIGWVIFIGTGISTYALQKEVKK